MTRRDIYHNRKTELLQEAIDATHAGDHSKATHNLRIVRAMIDYVKRGDHLRHTEPYGGWASSRTWAIWNHITNDAALYAMAMTHIGTEYEFRTFIDTEPDYTAMPSWIDGHTDYEALRIALLERTLTPVARPNRGGV